MTIEINSALLSEKRIYEKIMILAIDDVAIKPQLGARLRQRNRRKSARDGRGT